MNLSRHLPSHFNQKLIYTAILTSCLTGLAIPGQAVAKAKPVSSSAEMRRLRAEVSRLQAQNHELQQALKSSSTVASHHPPTAANPFVAKEVAPTTAQLASTPKMGEMKCGAGMMGASGAMPKEHRFTMNPVWGGLDMFWNMPKDTLMMNVKWMHNQQGGLQNGGNTLSAAQSAMQYMMPPTGQSMDMFMFMPMWGVTEDLTLMAMINYSYMSMPMDMSMMGTVSSSAPMNVGGIADTNLDAIYRIADNLVGTFQINIPTGSTQQMYSPAAMGPIQCSNGQGQGCYNELMPYNMQLGAGVVGLMPALTYNWFDESKDYNLGGQISGTAWVGNNDGWSPGNSIKLSAWAQTAIDDFGLWLRSNYTNQASLSGCSDTVSGNCQNPNGMGGTGYLMPGFNPSNYGGEVANIMVGASYNYKMFSLGIEGGVPYYQNFNGTQNMNSYQINSGVSMMW